MGIWICVECKCLQKERTQSCQVANRIEESRKVSFIWIDFFQKKITAISDSFNKKMSRQIIITEEEKSCDFFGIFWQVNGHLISPKYANIDI